MLSSVSLADDKESDDSTREGDRAIKKVKHKDWSPHSIQFGILFRNKVVGFKFY